MLHITRLHQNALDSSIKGIGADAVGTKIMQKKATHLAFEVDGLGFEAINILKQEALSLGAECATPKGAISHKGAHKALLFGTKATLELLLKKLAMQPFNLKSLKSALEPHIKAKAPNVQKATIMAIINVTPDSFYANSRQDERGAIDRIYALLESGITLIDIGAASSRPGSEMLESSIEISRLKGVLEHIYKHNLYKKATFSIDTYNAKMADVALDSGFKIINDVSGLSDKDMIKVASKHKAQVILMHTKGTPKQMQSLTNTYTHLFNDIDDFFANKIALLNAAGVEDIILDIGFGFAKNRAQNVALIKHLEHFLHFNYPLLVGASRKSSIGEIVGKEAQDRLSGTLALHLLALQNGASILRVHDEKEHLDMLNILKAFA